MTARAHSDGPIALWQGFRHKWQYNHRANRLGSYVRHASRAADSSEAEVVHTAASGTGPDRADFTDLFTKIKVEGVGFQQGYFDVKLETVEEKLTNFSVPMEVALEPAMAGKDIYTVVLNGFDLVADDDADKLITLALEATDPIVSTDGEALTFALQGAFRVDCSSPECDQVILLMRQRYSHRWDESVFRLDWELQTAPLPSDTIAPRSPGGKAVVNQMALPLTREVRYTLRLHYIIIAGNHEALHVTPSRLIEHRYKWDRRQEISARELGKRPLVGDEVIVGDSTQRYAASTLAFKQIIMSVYRDTGERRFYLWQRDKAMHLLELNLAISDMKEVEPGSYSCTLDMFFKNWSKRMKGTHLLPSLFAYRDGGEAQFGAQLTLLQFRDAELCEPGNRSDSIKWLGGGRSATNDPAALNKYTVRIP